MSNGLTCRACRTREPIDGLLICHGCSEEAMESDPIYKQIVALEQSIRAHNRYRAAHPLFLANVHKVTPPKSERRERVTARKNRRKLMKARYDKCVADGICTECRHAKADHGRMCTSCNEKSRERWRKRAADLSQRRAQRRSKAV